ncbi:sensor histidine kinase [Siansivirga zeaxanthinifaciens]|uniref:histidine kinase n=1 Tax=Siansivirga zeaxanthinifaciens CC-SAMT-1 TaxID=1454006 RepID=A0A0C5VY09_9FLAO|nr:GAF domain-containing sensor histidine kinase [Siansivirga zeaxanthinifaciens]AJR04006.1 ATPase [Siansivirga zeaxanthinifaciens CC-SAMT-1]
MIKPQLPENESERLEEVKKYNLLDTLPESDFDDIANLIAKVCNVPISLITLLDKDRNFLKAHIGITENESPRALSLCGHAILTDEPIFIVENTREDIRFHDNPIITGNNIGFYAGVPLINPEGYALGTLCVYDHVPRTLTAEQKETLIILSKQVINLFELRYKNIVLNKTLSDLEERHQTLKTFANKISHDLKSPLANITSLSQLFKEELLQENAKTNLEYLNYIEESADTLRAYIDGILKHYKSEALLEKDKKQTTLQDIYNSIKNILGLKSSQFKLVKEAYLKDINSAALTQILLNLVDNGFKYNFKENPVVSIDYSETETHHVFIVEDNGKGIEQEKQDDLFELFNTAHDKDKHGNVGTGIGLFTVKTLVNKLNGAIDIHSEIEKGTQFILSLPK